MVQVIRMCRLKHTRKNNYHQKRKRNNTTPPSTIRIRKMGGDGGTFGVNRNYMRGARLSSREEVADKDEQAIAKYTTCAISAEPLSEPIVACELGYLYDKEQVIKHLIQKTIPQEFSHIRNLKDLIPCHFTPNPAYKAVQSESGSAQWTDPASGISKYICPVTLLEVNGKHDFCVLKPSGKVMSMKSLLEVPTLSEGQVAVKLFPSDNEIRTIRERLAAERHSKKLMKKDKKSKKKRKREDVPSSSPGSSANNTEVTSTKEVTSVTLKHGDLNSKQMQHSSNSELVQPGQSKLHVSDAHQEKLEQNCVYAGLFTSSEDHHQLSESERKKRLFMIGNPRGNKRGG